MFGLPTTPSASKKKSAPAPQSSQGGTDPGEYNNQLAEMALDLRDQFEEAEEAFEEAQREEGFFKIKANRKAAQARRRLERAEMRMMQLLPSLAPIADREAKVADAEEVGLSPRASFVFGHSNDFRATDPDFGQDPAEITERNRRIAIDNIARTLLEGTDPPETEGAAYAEAADIYMGQILAQGRSGRETPTEARDKKIAEGEAALFNRDRENRATQTGSVGVDIFVDMTGRRHEDVQDIIKNAGEETRKLLSTTVTLPPNLANNEQVGALLSGQTPLQSLARIPFKGVNEHFVKNLGHYVVMQNMGIATIDQFAQSVVRAVNMGQLHNWSEFQSMVNDLGLVFDDGDRTDQRFGVMEELFRDIQREPENPEHRILLSREMYGYFNALAVAHDAAPNVNMLGPFDPDLLTSRFSSAMAEVAEFYKRRPSGRRSKKTTTPPPAPTPNLFGSGSGSLSSPQPHLAD